MTSEQESDLALARRAAIGTAVSQITTMLVVAAISLAIAKRDVITRAWMRVRNPPVPAHVARERRLIAELRRDLADIERGGDGPIARPRGLYEQW